MHRLTIEVDDDTYGWIERRRGGASPEKFAARAIAAYRTADEHGTAARMTQMHVDMERRLDELQQRIRRLDRSLRERPGPDAQVSLPGRADLPR
jgi:hypothetical protein